MNAYEYLKPGAIVPVTNQAIKDLVDLAKQQADLLRIQEYQIEMLTKAKDDAQNGLETAINFSKTLIEKYK